MITGGDEENAEFVALLLCLNEPWLFGQLQALMESCVQSNFSLCFNMNHTINT